MKPKEKAVLLARLSALAQETRLDVVHLLAMRSPEGLFATDIAQRLNVPKNTMSTHFRILEEAGLIRGTRDGRTITYRALMDSLEAVALALVQEIGRESLPDSVDDPGVSAQA